MSRIKCDYNRLSNFHKKLHKLIEEIGLSVPELANKIGVSKSAIRDGWFNRENYPGADKIIELLKLSKRDANWLFDQKGKTTCDVGCCGDLIELCRKVKKVIESKTGFAGALESNILMFDESVEIKRRLERLEKLNLNENHGESPNPPGKKLHTKKKAM